MKKHLAIDLGATSGRVIVGNLEELEVIHRFPTFNEKILNSYHWDIIKIFSEIKNGIKKAFEKYEDEIISVAIDGWGVDYALLDNSGSLISPLYHYRDPRTSESIGEVIKKIGSEYNLFKQTGNSIAPYNTIFQLYSTKEKRGDLFKIADTYLSIPDLIAYFLSGVKSNEISEASTTQLYDSDKKDWNKELIEQLGIPSSIFLKPIESGTILGELTDDLKAEFKINHSVKVIACATHDTASAISTIEDDSVYISSGTWSLLGTNLKEKLIIKEVFDNGFTNECGSENNITLVKNIMGMWITNELLREEVTDEIDWKELDRKTMEQLSYEGEINPLDKLYLEPGSVNNSMKDRIERQLKASGFKAPTCLEQYLVAIYKGLSNIYNESIKQLEKLTNKKFDKLIIVGGGSKNYLLNQLTANRCKMKVQAGPIEATALGNILLQAKSMNVVSSLEEGRALINKNYKTKTFQNEE